MPVKKALKYISLLLVFTLLAVGTTYVLIQRANGEPLFTPKIDRENEEIVPEAGIDLNGFYDQNHLVFTEITEPLGEDREFTYPQISGLVNKDVEAAVNAAIAAEAEALKQHFSDKGTAVRYATYTIYANFSNVLSIGLFAGDETYDYTNRYMNFNLNDGSLLRVEDLFGVQADLLGLVRGAFYESLTTSNLTDEYWETAQSPDENELYEVVMGYMAGEKEFFFTPTEICFSYGDYVARVDMVKHAADITVYHKYLSEESLFERDDIGYKNIFTCVHIPEGFQVREFGFAGDNVWYDFGLSELYFADGTPQETIDGITAYADTMMEIIRAEVEGIIQGAVNTPDTMYIYMANPSLQPHIRSDYSEDGGWQATAVSKAVAYGKHVKIYTMPKALFDSKYRQLMIELYRKEPYYLLYEGLDNLIDNDVQRKRDDSEAMYRWDTGEEITAETLFAADYDADTYIRSYAIDELVQYHGYTLEDAQLLTEALWYELTGGGLQVNIPAWEDDRFLWLSLDQFAPGRLTIFD